MEDNPENLSTKSSTKKEYNLLKYQFRFLSFAGMLPSESISRSLWKMCLYNSYSFLVSVLQLPAATLLFITVYDNWGEFELISDVLFLASCYVNQAFTSVYFLMNRDSLRSVLHSLEGLVAHAEKVAPPSLQNKYIGKAARSANRLVFVVISSISFIYVSWIMVPLVSALIPVEMGTVDRNDESLNKIIYLMWVPNNFTEAPKLELVLAFKSFSIFFGVLIFATTIVLILVMTSYMSSYFELLCECIENVEDLLSDELQKVENENEKDITENENNTFKRQDINGNEMDGNNNNFKIEDDGLKSLAILPVSYDSDGELYPRNDEPSDDQVYRYLSNCVAFHQELLEVCGNVDELLNPALLVFFFCSELTMCFSAFALAQGVTDDVFKIFVSVFNVCIWPLIMCYYGDDVKEKSEAVGFSAYSCLWYNRSTSYKNLLQMIIMRAQSPVVLRAGKFYDISLETFAEIANVVYGYYSILKGQSEEEEN